MRCEDCIHEKVCEGFSNCEEVGLCEPKRKHGEWIFTGRYNVYGCAEIECSNCHNKPMISMSQWIKGENFCDVCGSQNKKEGDKEEKQAE